MTTMIKTISLLIAVLFFKLLTLTQCKKTELTGSIPSCIQTKISAIKTAPVRNPTGSVWQAEYKGNTVYFIPQYCCDIPSELFDNNCNLICNPDGGITGSGDGKCADFFSARKNVKLIWQDTRK